MRKDAGFTLLEVMVVVAIIGLMSAFMIPGFRGWLPDYRLRSAVDELHGNLQLAKMSAIRSDVDHSIFFDTALGTYAIREKQGGGDVVTKTIQLSGYGSGVGFGRGNATINADDGSATFPADGVSFASPDNEVVFNSRGMVDGNNLGWIYLRNSIGTAYAVGASSIAGLVVTRRWNGTSWQ